MSDAAPLLARVDDRVHVAAPFALRDRMRSIPGARWSPAARAWTFPATPAVAASLRDVFGGAAAEPLADLLAVSDAARQAQNLKRADVALAPLPWASATPPWRHQLAAVRFTEHLPAALWHMGLGTGKTRAALDLARLRDHRRILVLAPLSVLPAWQVQADRHAPGQFAVEPLDSGSTLARARWLSAFFKGAHPRRRIAVLNYDAFWREAMFASIQRAEVDFLVMDEAHKLKSPSGRASRAAAMLAARTPAKLALTGTPMPHSPLDAYAVFRALDPGIFGTSFFAFRARYALMGGFQQRQVVAYQRTDEFAAKIAGITFEVDRSVLDLPDAVHVERTFALPPAARDLYQRLGRDLVADLDHGTVTTANALTRLLRLSQIASGHVGYDLGDEERERRVETIHAEKQRLLEDILEEAGDEPVVVFCLFRHDLAQVHAAAAAAGSSSAELSGSRRELDVWQRGDARVLACQVQSGSEGIDLTRARYCVFFSVGYSLGQYEQALARVHRPGQSRPVTYLHLIAEGTVDRHVRRALEARREVLADVVDAIRRAVL